MRTIPAAGRPITPPPSEWRFPPAESADSGVVAIGADLRPGTILEAYRNGIFPMPIEVPPEERGPAVTDLLRPGGRHVLGWWSPDPRGVVPLDGLRITRSLRRSLRRFDVTFDTDFETVIRSCAEPDRDGGWIDEGIIDAYVELHRLGWAHSVEVRDPTDGRIVGGLYGVHIAGLFAGESMFHRTTDASKVALVALVDRLRRIGVVLLDTQWLTPHLASLGAVAIPRAEYLQRLQAALTVPAEPFAPEVRP